MHEFFLKTQYKLRLICFVGVQHGYLKLKKATQQPPFSSNSFVALLHTVPSLRAVEESYIATNI